MNAINRIIPALAIAWSAVACSATQAEEGGPPAPAMVCGDYDGIKSALLAEYKEEPLLTGDAADGSRLGIFTAEGGATWSAVRVFPPMEDAAHGVEKGHSMACVFASGTGLKPGAGDEPPQPGAGKDAPVPPSRSGGPQYTPIATLSR